MVTKKNELTLTEVAALYQSDKLIYTPTKQLFRIDGGDVRFYYSINPDTKAPKFYTSWTSLIGSNMPTSPYLVDWKVEMGKEESEAYTRERASYGTFMHIQIEDFMIKRVYDFDLLADKLIDWGYKEGLNSIKWYWEMRKDLLSFVQFAHDVDLEPIAIEIALASDAADAAGSIDLVGKMNIEEKGFFGEEYKTGENKGKPKESKRVARIRAIIDFKSGKKGFYDSHIIQLHGYKQTWNENFPDVQIERVFNWAPSDWRETPGYKLEEQTNKWQRGLLPSLIAQNKVRIENGNMKPRDVMQISGIATFGTDVAGIYKKINIIDYIKNKE